jgi:hypothetical protein
MRLTATAANGMLTSLATSLNSGRLRIYSGPEPVTADTALSGNNLLVDIPFGNPAFTLPPPATAAGTDRVMNAITASMTATAVADGNPATFFRATSSDGNTTYYQGTVGTSGQQLNLTSLNIVTGGTVSITALSVALPVS